MTWKTEVRRSVYFLDADGVDYWIDLGEVATAKAVPLEGDKDGPRFTIILRLRSGDEERWTASAKQWGQFKAALNGKEV